MDEFENLPQPPEDSDGLTAKQTFSRVGWTFATMLGSATLVKALLVHFGSKFAPGLMTSDWSTLLLSLLPLYLIALPLGWLILRRLPADKPTEYKLSADHFLMFFVMCFAVVYIGNLVGVALNMGITTAMGSIYDNPVYDLIKGSNVWANLVCVVLVAPVMEEFVFRKLLCDRVRVFGEGTAIFVSGLVFGLFHGNLYQFFYAFGIGMLFAYIYLRTGHIYYTMLLHACINFFGGILPQILLNHIDLDALSKLSTDDTQAILTYAQAHTAQMLGLGLYVMTALALFVVGLVFLILRRKQIILLPAEKQLSKGERGGAVIGNAGMIVYLILALAIIVFVTIRG